MNGPEKPLARRNEHVPKSAVNGKEFNYWKKLNLMNLTRFELPLNPLSPRFSLPRRWTVSH